MNKHDVAHYIIALLLLCALIGLTLLVREHHQHALTIGDLR